MFENYQKIKRKFYETILMNSLIAALVVPSTTVFANINVSDNTAEIIQMPESVSENSEFHANEIIIKNEASAFDNNSVTGTLDSDMELQWLFAKSYICTGDNVNVRTKPSKKSKIVGILYKGDVVKVKSINRRWAKIKWNGKYRYVSARYLTEK